MSVRGRLRLWLGVVSVLLLAAWLTMDLNARKGVVESRSAQLAAISYPVGTDYSGTVVEQLVKVGDTVSPGQPMFRLQSTTLQRDLTQGLIKPDAVHYRIERDGTAALTATDKGRVETIDYAAGSFVPANSVLATVQRAGSIYVEAEFLLTATDYARLPPGADVDVLLPSNNTVRATAGQVRVQTDSDGQARTRVTAQSPELGDSTADGLFAVGTPVTATLHLRNDGVVTDMTRWFTRLTGVTP